MASIDRLSSLPEGIICHILSFLPTKRSVATSVLGKRWRFLWAHVPCLEFSGYDFRKEDFGEEETQSWDDFMKEATQASNIIHGIILRHKAKRMDSLTLDHVYCDEDQLETWIKTAIDRGVRNLHLELDFDTIPQSLFNCKTIVDLKLDKIRMSLSDVGNVSLPSLKKFYVYNLISENDDVLPRFLSGCPSLEELNMVFTFREENDYVGCKNISSPKLKTLKLNLVDLFCPWQPEYRMIINAPALRYLQVHGYDLECITIPITMISLVEADIRLANYWLSNLKTTVVKFFHSLCYVKCLKISCWKFGECHIHSPHRSCLHPLPRHRPLWVPRSRRHPLRVLRRDSKSGDSENSSEYDFIYGQDVFTDLNSGSSRGVRAWLFQKEGSYEVVEKDKAVVVLADDWVENLHLNKLPANIRFNVVETRIGSRWWDFSSTEMMLL
ncbi:Putative F-box/FBD/LRR-repeat protein [Striga hermonthica]|uniref:F-box/FBD/LRR-repeat protein n=1 Tax=Striga hermonthica TaxID=68872 RepID=A0A9N7MJN6_STRHE|nr:Putative F-box/FBD/LRR-repeat protein [Striga hermonthica]